MDPNTFTAAEQIVDKIAGLVEQKLDSASFKDIRDALERLGRALGTGYAAEFEIGVRIFDRERNKTLRMLTTGYSTADEKPPFRTWGDSSRQRYLLAGQIHMVPDDCCPRCWEDWIFKFAQPTCPWCSLTLGEDCKVLLDSNRCPHCDKGTVTLDQLVCDECGFEVDPDFVTWG